MLELINEGVTNIICAQPFACLPNHIVGKGVIKKIRQDGKEFPDITPHVFRHTFATRAIEEGMPPQVLKTIMGHSSLAITMDLYSHVMEDTKQKEMLSIANAF